MITSVKSALVAATALVVASSSAIAQPAPAPVGVHNVLLVHGAFADGSGWRGVYDILTHRGYHVGVVQIPLTSLRDDVAAVDRVLARQDGPAILVGHSYGGVVITEAGADSKVAGLVYVAAFAPHVGESGLDQNGTAPAQPTFVPESANDGFLFLKGAAFKAGFAADLKDADVAFMRDSQVPIHGAALGAKVTTAAWMTKPSWYVVATQDGAINPALERKIAIQSKAKTTEVKGSHVVFVSQPLAVANVITSPAPSKSN
jgi:pimeloyl-ACP methyl ester carboxylesterase